MFAAPPTHTSSRRPVTAIAPDTADFFHDARRPGAR
jgi:hypothetical protein